MRVCGVFPFLKLIKIFKNCFLVIKKELFLIVLKNEIIYKKHEKTKGSGTTGSFHKISQGPFCLKYRMRNHLNINTVIPILFDIRHHAHSSANAHLASTRIAPKDFHFFAFHRVFLSDGTD